MPTTRYTVFDGEIVSESRAGVLHDYVSDPLGSTVALLDNTQTQTDQWAYFPYGESVRLKGTTATPMLFVGNKSCRQDSTATRSYMQNRFLEMVKAQWMTEDPIGFVGGDVNLYRYARNRPTFLTDESGLNPLCIGAAICAGAVVIAVLVGCRSDPKGFLHCLRCYCSKYPAICIAVEATCGALIVGCIGVTLPVPVPTPPPVYAFGAAFDDMSCYPKPGKGRRPKIPQLSGDCDSVEELGCIDHCERCRGYKCRKEYGCQCIDCPQEC